MILSETDYRPVTLKDKAVFKRIFAQYPQVHSEYSFMNMVCWEHYAPYSFTVRDGRLLTACTVEEETTYRAPIGELSTELFEEVLALAQRSGGKMAMDFYNESDARYLKEVHPEIPVYTNRGFSEYYYRTEELAELKGRKYLNIRGQINRFNAEYSYTSERITETDMLEVQEMIEAWSISKHCEANLILKEEMTAVLFALDHWQELGCEGLMIRIMPEENIAAIAIWEMLNASTALVHFEKGFVKYKGIYKIINQETAKHLRGICEWINRESDMDVPGLREAKMRYHPDHCAKAWYINKNEIVL